MRKNLFIVACLTLLLVVAACHDNTSPEAINLDNTPKPHIELHRYETALFKPLQSELKEALDTVAEEFAIFLGDQYDTPQNQIQLLDFINTPQHQAAWQVIREKYGDLTPLVADLENAFQRITYYYPDTKTPVIYTYISGFDWESSLYIINDTILLGLDNFLGDDFSVYQQLQIPRYISCRMDEPYILPMLVRTWAEQYLLQAERPETLLEYMIYCGKELYFIDAILPAVSAHVKMGYTPEKWAFCENNEQNIWRYLIDKKVLFSKERNVIRTYIQEAPYTGGLMPESPGRLGQWVGWQIVRSYMQKNPNITLQQLMQTADAQKILNESGYRPK